MAMITGSRYIHDSRIENLIIEYLSIHYDTQIDVY